MSSTSASGSSSRPPATPRRVSSASSPPESQPGREAVAPLDLAEEGLAVLGVSDRAGCEHEHPLGAEPLELAAVAGEDVADARDRRRQQFSPLVDALAEPRDRRFARGLVDAPVLDVRNEQPSRIGAEIDHSDAHFEARVAALYFAIATRGGAVR
jgi:hypothetical protein